MGFRRWRWHWSRVSARLTIWSRAGVKLLTGTLNDCLLRLGRTVEKEQGERNGSDKRKGKR
jgi:hypothetical protein